MAREAKTPTELKDASWRLLYEYAMLLGASAMLERGKQRSTVVENALVESFALHARGLTDFFRKAESQDGDDIKACDFKFARNWSPPKTHKLDGVRDRVAKEIAHLTYARLNIKPGEGPWQTERIAEPIRKWVQGFQGAVEPGLLHHAWATFDEERFVEGLLKHLAAGQIIVRDLLGPSTASAMPEGIASYLLPNDEEEGED